MAEDYFLATTNFKAMTNAKGRIIFYPTIASARAEARRQSNTFSDINEVWILKIVKDGAKFVGCVLFDRSKAGYHGLGWVFVSPNRARAVKIYMNGDIAEFNDPKDLRHARNLKMKYWA